MMRDVLNLIAALAIFAALFFALTAERLDLMPQCPEDAVLVGVGDYADGRWSAYRCGPSVDD